MGGPVLVDPPTVRIRLFSGIVLGQQSTVVELSPLFAQELPSQPSAVGGRFQTALAGLQPGQVGARLPADGFQLLLGKVGGDFQRQEDQAPTDSRRQGTVGPESPGRIWFTDRFLFQGTKTGIDRQPVLLASPGPVGPEGIPLPS